MQLHIGLYKEKDPFNGMKALLPNDKVTEIDVEVIMGQK